MRATWWWIDRWRKSTAFTDMSLEEQGAYRNLCDEVVIREGGVIPEASLARASGDAVAWPRLSKKVLAWMKRVRGGWTNETALEVKAKSEELSQKQRDRAVSGWRKRKSGTAPADAAADAPAMHEEDAAAMPPSPSPSPSPDTSTDQRNSIVGLKPDDPLLDAALEVFQYWRLAIGKPGSVRTPGRLVVLRARLREEPGDIPAKVAGLKLAVDGALRDPWYNGAETGRTYLDFDNIFRNKGRDRIEKLQRLAQNPERIRGSPTTADRVDAEVASLIGRRPRLLEGEEDP